MGYEVGLKIVAEVHVIALVAARLKQLAPHTHAIWNHLGVHIENHVTTAHVHASIIEYLIGELTSGHICVDKSDGFTEDHATVLLDWLRTVNIVDATDVINELANVIREATEIMCFEEMCHVQDIAESNDLVRLVCVLIAALGKDKPVKIPLWCCSSHKGSKQYLSTIDRVPDPKHDSDVAAAFELKTKHTHAIDIYYRGFMC